jgi:hypothetical protein
MSHAQCLIIPSLNDLSSFLKTINFYFQKPRVNHKFLTPKLGILITYSKPIRYRLNIDILHTRGCRKRRFTTGLSKQTFHAPPTVIIAIQQEKLFMAHLLRGASCCRQGLSLPPQNLTFVATQSIKTHTKRLPNSINIKSLMRCILVEVLLTNLNTPQSSGTKFGRKIHQSVKLHNLVQFD